MTNQSLTRRRTLALTGSTLAVGLAGCLSDSTNSPTNNEDDGTAGEDASHDGSDTNDYDGSDTDDYDGSDTDDHDHDIEHTLGHPEEHIEVAMESTDDAHHFVPHAVHIEQGGTVTWILDTGVHDTVAYHPENASILPSATEQRIPDGIDPWASDVYGTAGETFEMTFEEEGIYDYTCTITGHGHRGGGHHGGHQSHESTGMVGRVIVGDPDLDSDEQPAMRPPSGELPEAARHELEQFNDQTRDALDEH